MEEFSSLGFDIWSWNPFLVAIYIFVIDFGVIMVLRRAFEGRWYLRRWWSFRLGDTVGLPVYAGFAAVIVQNHNTADRFYNEVWWHLSILGLGVVLAILQEFNAFRSGSLSSRQIRKPSQLYHTAIFGPMFYYAASVFFPVMDVTLHDPGRDTLRALVFLLFYLGTYVYDTFYGEQEPETDF
ncbi:MAG: hypothetical protein Q8P13_03590 [bacterium]|nr:hypothetical protein [bacterium]